MSIRKRMTYVVISNETFDAYAKAVGPKAWLLYCCLVRQLDEGYTPTTRSLAHLTGLTEKQVSKASDRLRWYGLLRFEHGDNSTKWVVGE